jgi:hypothetical protein
MKCFFVTTAALNFRLERIMEGQKITYFGVCLLLQKLAYGIEGGIDAACLFLLL